jgi:hypothetical protein
VITDSTGYARCEPGSNPHRRSTAQTARLNKSGKNEQGSVEELDEWLHRHARSATGQGTRTYVLVDADASFSAISQSPRIACGGKRLLRGSPGVHHVIPAILLAKLAVDRSLHGSGLGSELLVAAIGTIVEAARSVWWLSSASCHSRRSAGAVAYDRFRLGMVKNEPERIPIWPPRPRMRWVRTP